MPKMKKDTKRSLPGVQRTDAFLLDPDEVDLETDPGQPLYDPRVDLPIDEAMVLNMMDYGVIEPVVFVNDGDRVKIVDGRRRTRHAREACRRLLATGRERLRMPAMRRRGADEELFGVMVSANAFRHQDDPVELARKAQRMLDMGRSEREVGVAFGWTASSLRERLRLLDAAAPLRRAVTQGRVSASAAAKLSSLPKEEQAAALERMQAGGAKVTVKAARQAAGKVVCSAPPRKLVRAVTKALEASSNPWEKSFAVGILWARGEVGMDEDDVPEAIRLAVHEQELKLRAAP